jgi:hypothetical protein
VNLPSKETCFVPSAALWRTIADATATDENHALELR